VKVKVCNYKHSQKNNSCIQLSVIMSLKTGYGILFFSVSGRHNNYKKISRFITVGLQLNHSEIESSELRFRTITVKSVSKTLQNATKRRRTTCKRLESCCSKTETSMFVYRALNSSLNRDLLPLPSHNQRSAVLCLRFYGHALLAWVRRQRPITTK